ncbi:hypothetical protein MCERE8_01355 [Candidatus Nanopelagicaceae bacterium]
MSTKTTFKRVALVAVAALGFGVLTSVAPASATGAITPTAITVGTTPVAQVGVANITPITVAAPFADTVDTFTVNVKITSAPTGSAFKSITTAGKAADGTAGASFVTGVYGASTVPAQIDILDNTSTWGTTGSATQNATDKLTVAALFTSTGWTTQTSAGFKISITPDVAGTYTVLVSTRAGSTLTNSYAAGDASATYTITTGGAVSTVALAAVTGATTGGTTSEGQIYKVTLKDASGAVAQLAAGETINITSSATTTNVGEIAAACASACTPTYNGAGVTAGLDSSNFSNGVGYIQVKDATDAAVDAILTATGSGMLSSTVSTTATFSTVKHFEFTSLTIADPLLSVRPGSGHKGVAGSGASYTEDVSTSTTSHSYLLTFTTANAAAKYVTVDMTDTSGQITGLVGATYSTYVAPALSTAATGAGTATLSVTTAAMLNGYSFTASVVAGTSSAIVVTSRTASSSGIAVTVEPNSVVKAAFGASSVLSAVVKDQFGAAVANHVVTVTTTGRNASVTGTTLATDANGRVTYTRTDAGTSATTNKQDVVTFTPTTGTAATVTINYTDSTLGISTVELETPTTDDTAASGITYTDINAESSGATGSSTARTWTAVTATVTDANGALLVGVPVVFKTTDAGAAVASTYVTVYTGTDGTATSYVYGWTAGVKTFTATAGTKTGTGTVAFRQGGATGSTSGNGEVRSIAAVLDGNTITVTAKDRFGNVVQGVPLWATRTGNGLFGGGNNAAGKITDANGKAEFIFNAGSADSVVTIQAGGDGASTAPTNACYGQTGAKAGIAVCSTATTQTAFTAYVAGTTTLAEVGVGASFADAGINSVTVAVAAGADVAQAAADAAAEATDAANAATDAANAAAEAADAATAAAQDAADAVAALSTQVTEMVSALKKQITALTNLVIKIQKKVKA